MVTLPAGLTQMGVATFTTQVPPSGISAGLET